MKLLALLQAVSALLLPGLYCLLAGAGTILFYALFMYLIRARAAHKRSAGYFGFELQRHLNRAAKGSTRT